jgi:hypothetical protein
VEPELEVLLGAGFEVAVLLINDVGNPDKVVVVLSIRLVGRNQNEKKPPVASDNCNK